jgi:proteasome accessory factor B
MAMQQHVAERLTRLENCLPIPPYAGYTANRILGILDSLYPGTQPQARLRAIQRDLARLVTERRIELVDPTRKPFQFRRVRKSLADDPLIWNYTLQQIRDLIQTYLPERQMEPFWDRLLHQQDVTVLGRHQFRIIADTLHLLPAELYPDVLHTVITALANQRALQTHYRNAQGQSSHSILHPLALIQRGPIPYLIALKNDEDALRLYALHRICKATVRTDQPARSVPDFNLDQVIHSGIADFGQGKQIELVIRVRGYFMELLRICPLSENQRIEDEPADAPFAYTLTASIPQTGKLMRWLLGAGSNIEVVAPTDLRATIQEQATRMMEIYR